LRCAMLVGRDEETIVLAPIRDINLYTFR